MVRLFSPTHAAALLLLIAPRAARGDGACAIRLTPSTAPAPWQQARDEAARRLSALKAPHDCRAVELVVHADTGVTLTFMTTDGRGTARALETPDDLLPALEALLVTAPAPRSDQAPPPPAAVGPGPVLRVLVEASGGARASFGPTAYLSPTIAMRPAVAIGSYELDALVELSPTHAPLGATRPAGFSMYSFTTAFVAGRRDRISNLALAYGVSFGVTAVYQEADQLPGLATSRSIEASQPRLGASVRALYPDSGSLRGSFGLAFDAALTRFRNTGVAERQLLDLPRFSASASLGVETSLL